MSGYLGRDGGSGSTDCTYDTRRYTDEDTRRGGFIAYSAHAGGETIFVEELVVSTHARGHGLQTGRRLFARLLAEEGARALRIHLIVWASLEHAVGLYTDLGFTPRRDVTNEALYVPKEGQEYMVADVAMVAHRLAELQLQGEDEWEVETAAHVGRMRGEDERWARRLYEDAHEEQRTHLRWGTDHAHKARHILMWHGQGIIADIHTHTMRRREDSKQATARRGDDNGERQTEHDAAQQSGKGQEQNREAREVSRGSQVSRLDRTGASRGAETAHDARSDGRDGTAGQRARKRGQETRADDGNNTSKAAASMAAAHGMEVRQPWGQQRVMRSSCGATVCARRGVGRVAHVAQRRGAKTRPATVGPRINMSRYIVNR